MKLADIMKEDVVMQANDALKDMDVTGLTADSRKVEPGFLFAALSGSNTDGAKFIADAVSKGAIAVLATPEDAKAVSVDVPMIIDKNPRQKLAQMAARFYKFQPERVAAVTGTNGKTSVVTFCRQLWQALGKPSASLGTMGVVAPDMTKDLGHTTPDPVLLHETLADLHARKIGRLAIEASSHGLEQNRMDGVRIHAAAFTNFSHDHLDYHETMEAYFEAKARLFSDVMPKGGVAVLNADNLVFTTLRQICEMKGHKVISYGKQGQQLTLLNSIPRADGQRVFLKVADKDVQVDLPLVGEFQIMNLLAAMGLVIATGEAPEDVIAALSHIRGVKGRLQSVGMLPNGAGVFVDYAHTPDALAHVLQAVRPHTENQLKVVFGAGGDRDKGKRPEMGDICARFADVEIVTDDNPRSEDPAIIRQEIMAACPNAIEIGDRKQAIMESIKDLQAGDCLVIAGKGHETGQIVGDEILPHDDIALARAAVDHFAGKTWGAGE